MTIPFEAEIGGETPNAFNILGQGLPGLSTGLSGLINTYNQQKQRQKTKAAFAPQFGEELADVISYLPGKEQGSIIELLAKMPIEKQQREVLQQKEASERDLKERKFQLEQQKFQNQQQKEIAQEEEKFRDIREIESGLNQLKGLITTSGGRNPLKGLLREMPGTPQYSAAQQLDSQGFLMADRIFTKFNKGVVSQPKWKDIKNSFAPNSKFSNAKNFARILALEAMAGLPENISPQKFNREAQKIAHKYKISIDSNIKNERPPLESFIR
jgi:hypothetical protein